ncbi:pyruvate ferredoxin/flavodoxin oxidoreductase [Methanococcus vannielii SB]|jgi:2-oxoglutarate ferredoxin oxidoreductase subunit gamma|uniref:Pyruvate ferredoxin/flavodoxin oxidoreductase n=1 Tax=Methanococcus vannielii (strain ATCC 35089 / DSM 1224 / JCM 13029 / OCM 148 / SB) TaxID=406327 RepID=A6UPV9_METVS|nr:2-oxoacid:ferredoxin oxidoreductase subunit gamma [Methanococcus vannielii]ABR54531.1 pyruvate ferredoxin/flavodoxin oxidoreductase [Methanococcus vannielii SB]
MRKEIRFSGFGGQGIILAGVILGKAASIYGEKESVQTQSYGPEARGGASKSEVVISNEEIDFPKVIQPDILISMSQPAFDKYGFDLKENAVVIIDKDLVTLPEGYEEKYDVYKVPFTEIANKDVGLSIVANIVMLGALVKITEVVSKEALEKSLLDSIPKGTEKKNILAFEKGYSY